MLMEKKDAPVFSLVNRQQLQRILDEDPPWPWYGQLMRRPQTIAYFLQVNDWMEKYGVQTLF
jgi:asparagine synthase (glutamine-hydrolysing)